jgi:predicted Zn-dependent peptidase
MKLLRTLAVVTAIILVASALAFGQKNPNDLKFPDLEFKPLKPNVAAVKSGITFYFKEDRESPTVSGVLFFKTGGLFEPKGKDGLAALTMTLLKSGGTKSLTPDKLEERLDFLGSTIYGYSGDEFSEISFWTLKKNFNETWQILTDMLFNPVFDKNRFETEKQKELENIRRRWDQPMMIGMYLYNELVYGKDFPDARRTTSASINGISLEDVKGFYEKNIKDREIVLAMAGDFESKAVNSLLGKTFQNWKAKPADKPVVPKAALAAKPGVYLIDKPDLTQAIVCMGHLGVNRLDPDNVEMEVMNFILGSGGFNSRIMREVRSNRGLAYSAFGAVGAGRDLGTFFNFTQTKSQSVGEAIGLIKDIIVGMTKTPVTDAELTTAKKYQQNAFVHRFDSSMSVLQQTLTNKLMGLPDNYLETYILRTKKVDAAKVLALAKRTMHPESLVILVVGKKSEVLGQLKALKLGEVKELPLPKE